MNQHRAKMNFKHLQNADANTKTATLLLYGGIGEEINGHIFAEELNYLQAEYDTIIVKINSPGGSVIEGLSIFNAMLSSSSYIISQIDGVAASMGGVIAMAGDEIRMNDFARLMVHNPSYGTNNLTAKEKKGLDSIRTMLVDILSRRGMDKDKMAAFMDAETWFTAEDAKQNGLVDEIISTGKKAAAEALWMKAAATADVKTASIFENLLINKHTNMKLIAQLFGLAENATETEIVAKTQELQNELVEVKAKLVEVEKLANEFKAEKETAQKKEIENLVVNAIKNGFYTEDQKDSIVEMGNKSPETFKAMLSGLKKPATTRSLTNELNTGADGDGKKDDAEEFERLRKEDPRELEEMKISDNDRFVKMLNAWEKKYC